MSDWLPIDQLWHGALAVVPVAAAAAVLGRVAACRPATRHAMWLAALTVLVAVPLVPRPALPGLAPAQEPQPLRGASAPVRDLPAGAPAPFTPTFRPPGAPAPPVPPPETAAPRSPQIATGNPVPATPQLRPRSGVTPTNRPVLTPRGATRDTGGAPAGGPDEKPPVAAVAFLRQWREGLLSVRDALLALPPLPAPVWAGGLLLGAAVAACGRQRARRLLAESHPAPPEVRRRVMHAAAQLGLRRPPVTLITDRAVPPMLWCGRRVRLVLPSALWAQLDEAGRDAVLYHELAHLRRRDHWVRRAELVIGWIWWWHPVVWWVRRRIREDADLCCDAWVTALMPSGRRAYAQALLEARRMSDSLAAGPAVGLGASTIRARRFARRLTMVMTAQHRPTLSLRGAALVGALALCGYVVSPLWACPPESKEAKEPAATGPVAGKSVPSGAGVHAAPRAAMAPRVPRPHAGPIAPVAPRVSTPGPAPEAGMTTFERFMNERAAAGGGDSRDLERRIQELERQIELLHEELRRLLHGDMHGTPLPGTPQPPLPPAPATAPPGAPPLAMIVTTPELEAAGAPRSGGWSVGCLSGAALSGGPIVARRYEVPGGKLEALGALMARADVPVRVRIEPGAIEVQASEGQQCVFETFLALINGQERATPYALPKGKLEALTELMVRSDVPVLVSPGDDSITLHGTDVEQAVFLAFLTLINPSQEQQGAAGAAAAAAAAEVKAAMAEAERLGAADRARQYEAQAAAAVTAMRELRQALRAQERQMANLQRQIERSREKADQQREKADEAESMAQEFEQEAADLAAEGARDPGTRDRVEKLASKAREAWEKAAAARHGADALEEQVQSLEEALAGLEEEVARLQEQLEDLEEHAAGE